jgi:hypothetical protein
MLVSPDRFSTMSISSDKSNVPRWGEKELLDLIGKTIFSEGEDRPKARGNLKDAQA